MPSSSAIVVPDFDAARHEYWVDGQRIPGVTEILQATRVSTDFEELSERLRRQADAIFLKRELGHALHADAHAYDDDDLDWSTVDPRVRPYLDAWVVFRQNSGLTPLARERCVFHPAYRYAGTLDGIFLHPNGRRILCDLKAGDPADAACHLQTAAYEAAYCAGYPDVRIDERWAVRLCPGLSVPYRITNYTALPDSWQHFQKFIACVTVYYEQPARRRAA